MFKNIVFHFKNSPQFYSLSAFRKEWRELNPVGVGGVCAMFEGRKEKESDLSV